MVGDAGLGEALKHPGIGVPRPRAGGERGGDFKRRKDLRHGNTLWSKPSSRNEEVQSSSRQDALRQDGASTDFGALEPLPTQGTRGKGRSPERGERGFFH